MHILTEQGTFILDSVITDFAVVVISSIISLIIGGKITIAINKKNNLLEARRNSALNEASNIETLLNKIRESIVDIECDMDLKGKIEKEHMDSLYIHLTKFMSLSMYVYDEKLAEKLLNTQRKVRNFNNEMKSINKISIDEASKHIYKQINDYIYEDIIQLSACIGLTKWSLVGVKKNEISKLEKYVKYEE